MKDLFSTLFGAQHRMQCMVSVIDETTQARQALAELHALGIAAGDLRLLTGQDILLLDDGVRRDKGCIAQRHPRISRHADEAVAYQHYCAEARVGHGLVVVRLDTGTRQVFAVDTAMAERLCTIHAVLATYEAHHVRYYGDLVLVNAPQVAPGALPIKTGERETRRCALSEPSVSPRSGLISNRDPEDVLHAGRDANSADTD